MQLFNKTLTKVVKLRGIWVPYLMLSLCDYFQYERSERVFLSLKVQHNLSFISGSSHVARAHLDNLAFY